MLSLRRRPTNGPLVMADNDKLVFTAGITVYHGTSRM